MAEITQLFTKDNKTNLKSYRTLLIFTGTIMILIFLSCFILFSSTFPWSSNNMGYGYKILFSSIIMLIVTWISQSATINLTRIIMSKWFKKINTKYINNHYKYLFDFHIKADNKKHVEYSIIQLIKAKNVNYLNEIDYDLHFIMVENIIHAYVKKK